MKRIFLLILLIFSLTSCTISVPSIDNLTGDSTGENNNNTENNDDNNKDNTDNTDNDSNKPNEDNSNKDDSNENGSNNSNEEKEFAISNPNFETRRIDNQSEITMDDFFNLGNTIDVKVTISDSEISKLQKDYEEYERTGAKTEVYRLATKVVIILTNFGNNYTWEFDNVGIRQKGNTSRTNISNGDYLNLNHYKLSFDETFDDISIYGESFVNKYGNPANSSREFLGMSGLDFKWNKNHDYTHIREIYANYLYRASGILVQHAGLSKFSFINSNSGRTSSMGLCTVYEPATKSFIKRSLKSEVNYVNMGDWSTEKLGTYGVGGSNYGDLYKCKYPARLTNVNGNVGVGDLYGYNVPIYDRKTNKDVDYNDDLLKIASKAISTGNYDEISKYVDLEYLAISEAVGFVVGNPDSMRYNNNNYMIYMRKTDGKMVFIPIDSDRCFGITRDWNVKNGYMYTGMLDRDNSENNDTLSLLRDTILASGDNDSKKLYLDFCNKIKNSLWAQNSTFNTYFDMAKSSYSDESFTLDSAGDNYSFANYMSNKLNQIYPVTNNNGDSNEEKIYNLYLQSTINNWGEKPLKFERIEADTYQVKAIITRFESDGDYFKFKINDGINYDTINWTLSNDLTSLIKYAEDLKSVRVYGGNVGETVVITINVKTNSASVTFE